MVITLEVQHYVKPGKEQEVMALIKERGGKRAERFPNCLWQETRTGRDLKPDQPSLDTYDAEAQLYKNWVGLLEAPARIKLRMSV